MRMWTAACESPVGRLYVTVTEAEVVAVRWAHEGPPGPVGAGAGNALLQEATGQLREYFAGRRTRFTLPLAPEGTAFQKRVWEALREIPHGKTVSYGALARAIGHPKAVRAVGAANGRNPLPVLVPCHRVIGADGTLTGFAGGLEAKRVLLELERRVMRG